MSQRNPMNERYTTDKKRSGNTRRSASSAKPKSAAASSVVTGMKTKKPGKNNKAMDKRSKRREERNKQYEAEKQYGDPPTKKFKIVKRLWVGFLVASIATVALSFAASKVEGFPEWAPLGFLIAAYACIIITLYLDLGQIRRMRKKYVAQMAAMQTKESRAEQKRRKAAQRKAAKEAEEKRKEEEERKANEKSSRADMSFPQKVKSFISLKK